MATWRAVTSGRWRFLPMISSIGMPNILEVASRITCGVMGRGWRGGEEVAEDLTRRCRSVSCSEVRLAKAATRIRAPSSTRMLSVMLVAMNSRTSGGIQRRLPLGLLAEDGEAGLEVGGLDVGDQAHLEPAAQAVLEGADGVGRPVGGQHDLAVGLVEVVEGVEELLLGLLLALDELDVVDEQHVDVAVAALEGVVGAGAHGVDELVEEGLGGDVAHPVGRVVLPHVVADGLQEVGLAQAGVAVDEQRVVLAGRRLGHGQGGGVGEPVGRADHEGVEGVPRVDVVHRSVPTPPAPAGRRGGRRGHGPRPARARSGRSRGRARRRRRRSR